MFPVLVVIAFGLVTPQLREDVNITLNAEQIKLRDEITRLYKSVNRTNVYATCGWVLFKEYVDYFTAVKKCEGNEYIGLSTPGGRALASIHSETENKMLQYMMIHGYGSDTKDTRYTGASNWAWIGLRKVNNTKDRMTTEKVVWDRNDWVWEDGSHVDDLSYTNWMEIDGEPVQPDMKKDRFLGYQTAARLYRPGAARGGYWDDTFTTKLHPYICKFNVPLHYVVYDEPMKWNEAKATCEARGLYFAKIRNNYENAEFVKAVHQSWGNERHHQNWIWIGASDVRESGHYEFYDQEQIIFKVPWAKKLNDNTTTERKGSQDHVAVSRWGEWDDSYGDHWDRPFACQCHAEPMPPHSVWVETEEEKREREERKKEIEERKRERQEKKEERLERERERQEREKERQERRKERQERMKEREAKRKERQGKLRKPSVIVQAQDA